MSVLSDKEIKSYIENHEEFFNIRELINELKLNNKKIINLSEEHIQCCLIKLYERIQNYARSKVTPASELKTLADKTRDKFIFHFYKNRNEELINDLDWYKNKDKFITEDLINNKKIYNDFNEYIKPNVKGVLQKIKIFSSKNDEIHSINNDLKIKKNEMVKILSLDVKEKENYSFDKLYYDFVSKFCDDINNYKMLEKEEFEWLKDQIKKFYNPGRCPLPYNNDKYKNSNIYSIYFLLELIEKKLNNYKESIKYLNENNYLFEYILKSKKWYQGYWMWYILQFPENHIKEKYNNFINQNIKKLENEIFSLQSEIEYLHKNEFLNMDGIKQENKNELGLFDQLVFEYYNEEKCKFKPNQQEHEEILANVVRNLREINDKLNLKLDFGKTTYQKIKLEENKSNGMFDSCIIC